MVQLMKRNQHHASLPTTTSHSISAGVGSHRHSHQRMLGLVVVSFVSGFIATISLLNITSIMSRRTNIPVDISVNTQQWQPQQLPMQLQLPITMYDRYGNIRRDDSQSSTDSRSSRDPSSSLLYIPSIAEGYVYKHGIELGLNRRDFFPSGCYLWGNYSATTRNGLHLQPKKEEEKLLKLVPLDIQEQVALYRETLKRYNTYISENFTLQLPYISDTDGKRIRYTDLRHALRYFNHSVVCDSVHVPLHAIFGDGDINSSSSNNNNMLLSKIQNTNMATGQHQYMEPLLPPLRSMDVCLDKPKYFLDMAFHVHDFQQICKSFSPYTRTIFIDMGASLLFHDNDNPAIYISKLYQKFGIIFDHVYAYEYSTFKPNETELLFKELVPDHWKTSYHWINVGVDPKKNATMNPFTMIKQHFLPEDFVVVKLDVDNARVEMPLLNELLNDVPLHSLVDQFYFEYHIVMKEMWLWGLNAAGTVHDAMKAMTQLREKGIPAHFWV